MGSQKLDVPACDGLSGRPRESELNVIIYGDFNCPYCYLASQRADGMIRDGTAGIEWRAVEHDQTLPVTGTRPEASKAAWDAELAAVAALALPGEKPPAVPPPLISNTKAAVAAYAEAVSDGVCDELRRRLFHAIWAGGRHLGSAYEVRRVVTDVMWRPGPTRPRLYSPGLPSALDRDPDLTRIVRRSGGTIAPDGGPLTAAGYRRIRLWRREWLALPKQIIPAVIGPNGAFFAGTDALGYLAGLTRHAGAADSAAGQGSAAVGSRNVDRQISVLRVPHDQPASSSRRRAAADSRAGMPAGRASP